MNNISILISTANQRANLKNWCLLNDDHSFVVVHQIYGTQNSQPLDIPQSDALIYKVLDYSGLSKSRNTALLLCQTKYAYIMDDDVDFDLEKIATLVEYMEAEKVDVASCRFQYQDGSFPKAYSDKPFIHNMLSVAKVASIEMCVNVESIRSHNIQFDERFGLGAELPSGEEYIFLTDCLKAGLSVKYYPVTTGVHPNETSGLDFFTSLPKIRAKREMLKRVFAWKSTFYILAFWLKKLPLVIRKGYGWQFTKALLLGGK